MPPAADPRDVWTRGVPTDDELVEITGSCEPGTPHVVWSSPGSLRVAELDAAWQRNGLKGLADQPGPWAVLLADENGHHVAATDHLGVQPLYWARTTQGHIALSSRLAALADHPDIDSALDYEGIVLAAASGMGGPAVVERTHFAAIRRVPWGHALHITPNGATRLERYWDFDHIAQPDESLSIADSAVVLREAIDRALNRLIPVDERVGAHVSGGLDCTSLALRSDALLGERGRGLVAGYSWSPVPEAVPRLAMGDERDVLDVVATAARFPIHLVRPDESGDWWAYNDPHRYPHAMQSRERWVLPRAASDGVTVMISGWGGDQGASFPGLDPIPHLLRSGDLTGAWRDASARPESTLKLLGRSAVVAVAPAAAEWVHPRRTRAWNAREAQIDAQFRAFSEVVADTRRAFVHAYHHPESPRRAQELLLGCGWVQHRTTAWYQTGRLWGVDYRYPLLDLDVITTALQLPWRAFRHEGVSRVAFRAAVAPWVPLAVSERGKLPERALTSRLSDPGSLRSKPEPTPPTPLDDPELDHAMQLVKVTSSR